MDALPKDVVLDLFTGDENSFCDVAISGERLVCQFVQQAERLEPLSGGHLKLEMADTRRAVRGHLKQTSTHGRWSLQSS